MTGYRAYNLSTWISLFVYLSLCIKSGGSRGEFILSPSAIFLWINFSFSNLFIMLRTRYLSKLFYVRYTAQKTQSYN